MRCTRRYWEKYWRFAQRFDRKNVNADISISLSPSAGRRKRHCWWAVLLHESARVLSTSFYFSLLRTALVSRTQRTRVRAYPTHVCGGGLHHAASTPMTCSSGKKISLRSCWIPSSSSNWNFSLPPPSIALLRPHFPSHSIPYPSAFPFSFSRSVNLSTSPYSAKPWSLGSSIVVLARK